MAELIHDSSSAEHPTLTRLKNAARMQGFRCLEADWRGYHASYQFECRHGHRFKRHAAGTLYKKPAPCPHCAHEAMRQRFLDMIASRGGSCLEDDYLGSRAVHRMRCAHGHEWSARGANLFAGSWCHTCAGQPLVADKGAKKWRIDQLHAKAAARGGQCLTETYLGCRVHHQFVCAAGHRWSAMAINIMKGTWCGRCARRSKAERMRSDPQGLAKLQAVARAKGGACLNEQYEGVQARYRFQCGAGHVWKAVGARVLAGSWCPQCNLERQRLGIEVMAAIAHERGGRCLSDRYINVRHHLQWECSHGHVWKTSPAAILRGCWCPACAVLRRIEIRNRHKRLRYERASGNGALA